MSATLPPEVQALATPMSMAERWSLPSSVEGGYLLADPLTGQRIDTERPPVWIQEDRVLAGGLAYLRRNAPYLDVTTLFVKHEFAEDLGDPHKGWYERKVIASDFYAYESLNSSCEGVKEAKKRGHIIAESVMAQGQALSLEHFLKVGPKLGMTSFEMRCLAAISLTNTPSFPADVTIDGTVAERALSAAYSSLLDHPDADLAGVANVGFQNVREWVVVSRLGAEVKRRFGELRSTLKGFVTFGMEHQDLQRKFEMQGVTFHNNRLKSLDYNTIHGFDMSGTLECGIVLPAEVPQMAFTAREISDYLKS